MTEAWEEALSWFLFLGAIVSSAILIEEVEAQWGWIMTRIRSAEKIAWEHIVQRCFNPKNSQYKNYGGRGITMCGQWRASFQAFLAHVGHRPTAQHSIDRFPNNDGNYEPGNVRWATQRQQLLNMRTNRLISFNGKTQTLKEWSEELGLTRQCIEHRLKKGLPLDKEWGRPYRPNRSLREEDIPFIRNSNAMGGSLAQKFGVSQATISMIRTGKIWTNLEKKLWRSRS